MLENGGLDPDDTSLRKFFDELGIHTRQVRICSCLSVYVT